MHTFVIYMPKRKRAGNYQENIYFRPVNNKQTNNACCQYLTTANPGHQIANIYGTTQTPLQRLRHRHAACHFHYHRISRQASTRSRYQASQVDTAFPHHAANEHQQCTEAVRGGR